MTSDERVPNEERIYEFVRNGHFDIDADGFIWRTAMQHGVGLAGVVNVVGCARRRAENECGNYLQMRVSIDGRRITTMAARVVWRHFNGPIPAGLTINHINGDTRDNRPSNLEITTMKEQIAHNRDVLKRGVFRDGFKIFLRKYDDETIQLIARRRAAGESRAALAAEYGTTPGYITKIVSRACG